MQHILSRYAVDQFLRFQIYSPSKFMLYVIVGAIFFINVGCDSNNQVQSTTMKSRLEDPANKAVIERINSISPNIHVDSNGSIVTTGASYEEMRELALLLSELGDSVNFLFPKQYEVVKDGRGRMVGKRENGFETTYEYSDHSIHDIPSSSRTQRAEETSD